jgi:hypothetical protein
LQITCNLSVLFKVVHQGVEIALVDNLDSPIEIVGRDVAAPQILSGSEEKLIIYLA